LLQLVRGSLSPGEFERHPARTVIPSQYLAEPRAFAISVIALLSFAKDIETFAELAEVIS
jgi:hypothetical protein